MVKTAITALALMLSASIASANEMCTIVDKYENEEYHNTWYRVTHTKDIRIIRPVKDTHWQVGDLKVTVKQCEQIYDTIKAFSKDKANNEAEETEIMARTIVYLAERKDKLSHSAAMRVALNATLVKFEALVEVVIKFENKTYGNDPL